MIRTLLFLVIIYILLSCNRDKDKTDYKISFYHWKTDPYLSSAEAKLLDTLQTNTVYYRFFDVEVNEKNEAFPIAVIREIDSGFDKVEVIPTIYLTNRCFQVTKYPDSLANKLKGLVNQMYQHHYGKTPTKLQLDCDWTEQTKESYFKFIEKLGESFEVSATIRLHQVKYASKTGVPPCKYGVLMLYNMGDIKDTNQNSIFSNSVIKNYIKKGTSYPIPLSLALPIYRWGIVYLPSGETKIINDLSSSQLFENKNIRRLNERIYQVDSAIFLMKKYLPENTKIKLEEVNIFELQKAVNYLRENEEINWRETIFYHLDSSNIKALSVHQLTSCKI